MRDICDERARDWLKQYDFEKFSMIILLDSIVIDIKQN